MDIVPTSTHKNIYVGLDFLSNRKAELKQAITDQKILITTGTQNLLTPASFTTYVFRSFSKGLNLVDGVMLGFKIVKYIRTLFRKFI